MINVLTTTPPRPDDIVERIAGPRNVREAAAKRRFRIWAAYLAGLLVVSIPFVPSLLGIIGVLTGSIFLMLVLVVWIGVTPSYGHATELIRNGVAYPAKLQECYGGRYGASIYYEVTWSDRGGREGFKRIARVKGAPTPGTEAIVFVQPDKKLVAIVANDYLYVV